MAQSVPKINLDAFSTMDLNKLLGEVMMKLRQRDVRDLQKNLITKSQRMTLGETVAQHTAKIVK